jgi:single-stranded-DNA-specific exonuclease
MIPIVTERRWRLKSPDEMTVRRLAEELALPALHARLLVARGIDSALKAEEFLYPSLAQLSDPLQMKGVAEAVERLIAAKECGETVCIHGDYDVDGVTAVALLVAFFRAVGIAACHVIPRRLETGYGLSTEGIDEAIGLGATLLITVDCGITSVAEAVYCKGHGVDLIITDHHTPGEIIPEALAVINPLQPGCNAAFRKFAGVGLAFKLAMALRRDMRVQGHFETVEEPNLRSYLDLVTLGTIADLVPLVGENRIMAAFGLKELSGSARTGITALKRIAAISDAVTVADVGFRMAPRINAAGRLDDAIRGVELLLSSDPLMADVIAAELDAANRERQEIEKEILADALLRMQNDASLQGRTAVVMASAQWHPGVIGIVASRVVEQCHRPVILLAIQGEEARGSGRSIPAFHLYNALAATATHLLKFGGHQQAAGLTLSMKKFADFYDAFDRHAAETLRPDDLLPELQLDAELTAEELNSRLLDFIDMLRPFGMGNPEPVFLIRNLQVASCRTIKDTHLKLRLRSADIVVEAIGFKMAGRAAENDTVDIACVPERNVWNGRESLQLRIKDIRKAGGAGGT